MDPVENLWSKGSRFGTAFDPCKEMFSRVPYFGAESGRQREWGGKFQFTPDTERIGPDRPHGMGRARCLEPLRLRRWKA